MPTTRIRPESTSDRRFVHALHCSAFETNAEADLVERLREATDPIVSLVAESNEGEVREILGHILFTPVTSSASGARLMGLAPMAVQPGHQRSGIGSSLVREGIAACREIGASGVVVLGHPDYYPRFGFEPSVRFGFRSEYDVPDEVFLALELTPGAFDAVGGVVRYHAAFGGL